MAALTFQEFERSKSSSVWVLNKTGRLGAKNAGNINISVIDGRGHATPVTIKLSIAPQDLASVATKKSLLESPEFRRLQARGFFEIIEDKDAAEMLKKPNIKAAYDNMLNAIGESETLFSDPEANKATDESSGEIDGFVLNLVSNEEMSEAEKMDSLSLRVEGLTKKELKYLVDNSKYDSLKSLCAQYLV
jgi:hypothetical protein